MAERTNKQGAGLLGIGIAACAVCCAPPLLAFLAAASAGTLVSFAMFGVGGLGVAVVAAVVLLRRRQRPEATPFEMPVTLGRKPDA